MREPRVLALLALQLFLELGVCDLEVVTDALRLVARSLGVLLLLDRDFLRGPHLVERVLELGVLGLELLAAQLLDLLLVGLGLLLVGLRLLLVGLRALLVGLGLLLGGHRLLLLGFGCLALGLRGVALRFLLLDLPERALGLLLGVADLHCGDRRARGNDREHTEHRDQRRAPGTLAAASVREHRVEERLIARGEYAPALRGPAPRFFHCI